MYYLGSFSSLKRKLSASSPFSVVILTRRSTAMKTLFQRVWFGLMRAIPQWLTTASAANTDFDDLFHSAWHFANAALDNFLYGPLDSAWSASPVAISCRVWHAHLWWLGNWYSRPPASRSSTAWNATSSVPSSSSVSLSTSVSCPKTENALTKFDPLSVSSYTPCLQSYNCCGCRPTRSPGHRMCAIP